MKLLQILIKFIVLGLWVGLLCSCKDNTVTAPDFSVEGYKLINNGMSLADVKTEIGEPLSIYSHIDLGEEGSFNLDGKVDLANYENAKESRHVYCYSEPKSAKADYHVYEVFLNSDSIVVGKQDYFTD